LETSEGASASRGRAIALKGHEDSQDNSWIEGTTFFSSQEERGECEKLNISAQIKARIDGTQKMRVVTELQEKRVWRIVRKSLESTKKESSESARRVCRVREKRVWRVQGKKVWREGAERDERAPA